MLGRQASLQYLHQEEHSTASIQYKICVGSKFMTSELDRKDELQLVPSCSRTIKWVCGSIILKLVGPLHYFRRVSIKFHRKLSPFKILCALPRKISSQSSGYNLVSLQINQLVGYSQTLWKTKFIRELKFWCIKTSSSNHDIGSIITTVLIPRNLGVPY